MTLVKRLKALEDVRRAACASIDDGAKDRLWDIITRVAGNIADDTRDNGWCRNASSIMIAGAAVLDIATGENAPAVWEHEGVFLRDGHGEANLVAEVPNSYIHIHTCE